MLLMLVLVLPVLFAGASPTPSPWPSPSPALAYRLPEHLPSPQVLATWELIQGQAQSNGSRTSYRFYVDPARPALYRITQYRQHLETEKLLWNAEPGVGILECYELLPEGWRRLEPGTDRYRMEMATAIRIYQLHRNVVHSAQP